jgi:hypothetical protein
MRVYVDGISMHVLRDRKIDAGFKLLDGSHTIVVKAWDTGGAITSSTLKINVGLTANQAPVPQVSLAQISTPSRTVRACTVNSYDPDGSISTSVVDFGDGSAPLKGTAVAHSYGRSGTFVITTTVTDNRGKKSSSTAAVLVP